MTKLGYARVSTDEQHVEAQIDALKAAGAEKLFIDRGQSGAKTHRPALDEMTSYARPGDIITITKLDRLGRSLRDLINHIDSFRERGIELHILDMHVDTSTPQGRLVYGIFGTLAEFERELIVERTKAGLAAARARGRVGGRKSALSPNEQKKVRTMWATQQFTMQAIAETFGVSRTTIFRIVHPKE